MSDFKTHVLNAMVEALKSSSQTVAAWECGSAANGTSDQYSDIDLTIIANDSVDTVFELLESTLGQVSVITHRWVEAKQFLPGYFQRVYFLENAPKHFFVDVAVFLKDSENLLAELFQQERHGTPLVHFDKIGIVKARPTNLALLFEKQKNRLQEIEAAFPVFKTEVLKSLDRGHPIDAFGFYFSAMLRPLVEVMGMLHRPARFDFGLRYLHKTFPQPDQGNIERFVYVTSADDLREKAHEVDLLFRETAKQVRKKLAEAR